MERLAHPQLFSKLKDSIPRHKRRKTGLNTRFDAMVQRMNVMHHSPPKKSRKRSLGSSSVSSYDAPETPVDAYEGLHDGRLGESFGVLKMRRPQALDDDDVDIVSVCSSKVSTTTTSPLPQWLSNTFSTLEKSHPLRLLLPEDKSDGHSSAPIEEPTFAFWPDTEPLGPAQTTNLQAPDDIEILTNLESPFLLPFSTPGPGSNLSMIPSSPGSVSPAFARPSSIPKTPPLQANSMHLSSPDTFHLSSPKPVHLPTPAQFVSIFSPEDIASYFHDEEAASDLLLSPKPTSNLPNVFSAPGPAYHLSRPPLYFDSTTEDPSSDPVEPETGYQVNYEDIDFHWTPFIQNRVENNKDEGVSTSMEEEKFENDPTPQPSNIQPAILAHISCPLVPPDTEEAEQSPASDPHLPADFEELESLPASPPPQAPGPVAFAPAPGIYLSPLKGSLDDEQEVEELDLIGLLDELDEAGKEQDDTKATPASPITPQRREIVRKRSSPSGSDTSTESIESWSD
ncbi:hypothetical protein C8J56DRAFT_1121329 [Mycena floridula]|nr:hypothetical protein C8J56DRAFT_1121329 [Mycena floridula]